MTQGPVYEYTDQGPASNYNQTPIATQHSIYQQPPTIVSNNQQPQQHNYVSNNQPQQQNYVSNNQQQQQNYVSNNQPQQQNYVSNNQPPPTVSNNPQSINEPYQNTSIQPLIWH